MMAALLLLLAIDPPTIPLAALATTARPKACVIGPVVYVRKQKLDGDWHVTIDDGVTKIVAEIIPELPLPVPKKGMRIKVCGVTRYDKKHKWAELHPITSWKRVQ